MLCAAKKEDIPPCEKCGKFPLGCGCLEIPILETPPTYEEQKRVMDILELAKRIADGERSQVVYDDLRDAFYPKPQISVPSDEELAKVGSMGWEREYRGAQAYIRAYRAIYIRACYDCANAIGVRSELVVAECVELIDAMAQEMGFRK